MRQAQGIYMISVVAETLEMHPQTLRKYERAGFITPLRMGTLRTYSDEDVARLRLIKHFVEHLGLNLSGVELTLKLTQKLLRIRMQLSAEPDPPDNITTVIAEIDESLADLGLKVMPEQKPEAPIQLPPPGQGWFHVHPWESIAFTELVLNGSK